MAVDLDDAAVDHGELHVRITGCRLENALEDIAPDRHDGPRDPAVVVDSAKVQAKRLHKALTDAGVEARLLEEGSTGFSTGVVVCTPYLAKGLEFDRVIIPDASEAVFATEMDRNLLYVACTRAMHRLSLISVGAPSAVLDGAWIHDARDDARQAI